MQRHINLVAVMSTRLSRCLIYIYIYMQKDCAIFAIFNVSSHREGVCIPTHASTKRITRSIMSDLLPAYG